MMARQWKKNGEVTRRKADSISERAFHADTTKEGDSPCIPIEYPRPIIVTCIIFQVQTHRARYSSNIEPFFCGEQGPLCKADAVF